MSIILYFVDAHFILPDFLLLTIMQWTIWTYVLTTEVYPGLYPLGLELLGPKINESLILLASARLFSGVVVPTPVSCVKIPKFPLFGAFPSTWIC